MFSLKLQILRFDVSMENAVSVHVLYSFKNLIDLILDFRFWDIVLSPVNCVIEIAIHQFEDQSKSSSWLIVEHLMKTDNVRVRSQPFEGLDLSEVFNFLY